MTGLKAMGVLILMGLALLVMLSPITAITQNTRTQSAQDTSLSCTQAVGAADCAVTLTAKHMYYDTSRMTVNQTAPTAGDVTAQATLTPANRITLTITDLPTPVATPTPVTFTVDYRVVRTNMSNDVADALNLLSPLLFLSVFVMLAIVGIFVIRTTDAPRPLVALVGAGVMIAGVVFLPAMSAVFSGLAGAQNTSGMTGLYNLGAFLALLTAVILGGYAMARWVRR